MNPLESRGRAPNGGFGSFELNTFSYSIVSFACNFEHEEYEYAEKPVTDAVQCVEIKSHFLSVIY